MCLSTRACCEAGEQEVVAMHRNCYKLMGRKRPRKGSSKPQASSPLGAVAWYGVGLFLCLFVHATLSAINTQNQRHNYRIERLTVMLRMRHESLLRILCAVLSPAHAEKVAQQLGMRRASVKDCEFVVMRPMHAKGRTAAKTAKATVTDARGAVRAAREEERRLSMED